MKNQTIRDLTHIAIVAALYVVLTVVPVSYTHLDVYKRQLYWFCSLIFGKSLSLGFAF